MAVLRAVAVAFSLYTILPMPAFGWEERERRWSLFFFPAVGAVLGGLCLGWQWLARELGLPLFAAALTGTALNLWLTGGFHADGYMDVQDALGSMGDREKKLAILRDPHVGAMAVFRFGLYLLLYAAALYGLEGRASWEMYGAVFVLSRLGSAWGVAHFPKARPGGLLHSLSLGQGRSGTWVLAGQGISLALWLCWRQGPAGGALLALWLAGLYGYWRKSKKALGGITGDFAGWYVLQSELCLLWGIYLWQLAWGGV